MLSTKKIYVASEQRLYVSAYSAKNQYPIAFLSNSLLDLAPCE